MKKTQRKSSGFGHFSITNIAFTIHVITTISNTVGFAFPQTTQNKLQRYQFYFDIHASRFILSDVKHLNSPFDFQIESRSYYRRGKCICKSSSSKNIPNQSKNRKNQIKKKKNKYAKYSKTEHNSMDPLEAMIAESDAKNKEIDNLKRSQQKKASVNPQRINHYDDDKGDLPNQGHTKESQIKFPNTKDIDPYDPTTYGFTELGTIMGAHGVHGEMKFSATTGFGKERLCQPDQFRYLKMPNRRSPRQVRMKGGRPLSDSSMGGKKNNSFLVSLYGIEDREAAKKMRGATLYSKEMDRPSAIDEDEYMISELIGIEVFFDETYVEEDYDEAECDYLDEEYENLDVDELEYLRKSNDFRLQQQKNIQKGKNVDLGGSFIGKVTGIVLAEEMCSIPGLGNDLLEITLPRGHINGMPSQNDEMVLVPFVPQIVPRVDLRAKEIYITPPPGLLDLTYYRQDNVRIKGFLPPAKD